MKFILHTSYPAYENGADKMFRNVGKQQSDAGEIPKRIHTRFKSGVPVCYFFYPVL